MLPGCPDLDADKQEKFTDLWDFANFYFKNLHLPMTAPGGGVGQQSGWRPAKEKQQNAFKIKMKGIKRSRNWCGKRTKGGQDIARPAGVTRHKHDASFTVPQRAARRSSAGPAAREQVCGPSDTFRNLTAVLYAK